MSKIIEASKISKSFDGNSVFNNVSLQLSQGNRMAIVGPSGSGKTTLLYVLGTYDETSSGDIFYHGQRLREFSSDMLAEYRFKIGFVFQESVLIGDMTLIENVMLPFVPRKGQETDELRTKAMKLADELKISKLINSRANTLSMGERRRAELVRALLKEPEILLADEPTANLDEESAGIVIDALRRQAEIGVGVAFSVHRDQRLTSIADTSLNILEYKQASDE